MLQEQSACLQLCIALLDQQIKGKLTNSIIVGFLTVNSINKDCNRFQEPILATSPLSALVKIAQLLLIQHCVEEHKAGRADFAGTLAAELQDRFIVFRSNSPIN